MRSLGIELAGSRLTYVLVVKHESGLSLIAKNRIDLGATRDRGALGAFQQTLQTIFQDLKPDVILIKNKPEKGPMMAGAAAIKMEGLVLANAPCKCIFVSGAKLNQCTAEDATLAKYYLPAFQCAVIAQNQK